MSSLVNKYAANLARVALVLSTSTGAMAAEDVEIQQRAPKVTLETFASPVLSRQFSPPNLTCYISNVGSKAVDIKEFQIRQISGGLTSISTSCGNPKSFRLRPGAACFIGAAPNDPSFLCTAQVSDTASVRGSLEERAENGKVMATVQMTPGQSQAQKPSDFETFASPQAFGAPNQIYAECIISNTGKTTAKVKAVSIISSTGQDLQITTSRCVDKDGATSPSGRLQPFGTCGYFSTTPAIDVACRAQVTEKDDIRGSLTLRGNDGAILNFQVMQ